MCEEYRMTDWEIEQEQALIDLKNNYKECCKCIEAIKEIVENEGDIESKYEEIKYYLDGIEEFI